MKETIMYCHKRKTKEFMGIEDEFWYNDFCNHPKTTKLYAKDLDVYRVRVREMQDSEESLYWGFWVNDSNQFEYVYLHRDMLGICFPYGIEAEVKHGHGKDCNVIIEEIKVMTKEEMKDYKRNN